MNDGLSPHSRALQIRRGRRAQHSATQGIRFHRTVLSGAELLFEVFSRRYERSATLVTSNLPFNEWTEAFGSERLTGIVGPAHSSRSYPGNERRELPAQGQQAAASGKAAVVIIQQQNGGDLQGRLPLRPKRAPQGGSQAYAPAVPANPTNQTLLYLGSGLLSLRPSGLFLLRP